MAPTKIIPPGRQRPLLSPTSSGKIPFTYPPTGLQGETFYKLFGDLSATTHTPLICLHGGPGVPHEYLLSLAYMHADHGIPVLFYDQIGCGESTLFPDKKANDGKWWSPELFMAELDNVIAHFNLSSYDLLGQSWGGMLAGKYATTQPRGLRKLVILDSPAALAGWEAAGNAFRAELPADVRETLDRCEREGRIDSPEYEEATMVFYHLYMSRSEPWAEELEWALQSLEKDNTVYVSMFGPNEFSMTGSLRGWDITEELKRVTKETVPGGMLVVNGAFEQATDEVMGPLFWNPSCRVKWVRFALSAHMPHLDESEAFLQVLGSFLMDDGVA